jgi:hypothetical protein
VEENPNNSKHHKQTGKIPLVVKLQRIGLPIPKIAIDSIRLEADSSNILNVKTSLLL